MKIYKRKILLEDIISRKSDETYGNVVEPYIYFHILLTGKNINLGLFSSVDVADNVNGDDYFKYGHKVSGFCESRIFELKPINRDAFESGFVKEYVTYKNYLDETINGVNKIIDVVDNKCIYTFYGKNDDLLGTENQNSGLLYKDLGIINKTYDEEIDVQYEYSVSQIQYAGEGWNSKNVVVSGLTKEDKNNYLISEAKIENNVFIDRGKITIYEKHYKISEINNMEQLITHGNKRTFKIIKNSL